MEDKGKPNQSLPSDEAGQETEDVALDLPSRHAAVQEVSRILVDVARDEIRDRSHFNISLHVRQENGAAILESQLRYTAEWLCENGSGSYEADDE